MQMPTSLLEIKEPKAGSAGLYTFKAAAGLACCSLASAKCEDSVY